MGSKLSISAGRWLRAAIAVALFSAIAPAPAEAGDDDAPPIVDYHVQRTCLRTGMVHITDEALAAQVRSRAVLAADDEWAVRRAAFTAVARLASSSGRDMGAVDWFLFQMRTRCPEVGSPDCAACPAAPACARLVDLFQPVRRTTFY